MQFQGTDGWPLCAANYANADASPASLQGEFKKLVGDYMACTERLIRPMRDLLSCIKSRRLTVANQEVICRSMGTAHAANICMWFKRNMKEGYPLDSSSLNL